MVFDFSVSLLAHLGFYATLVANAKKQNLCKTNSLLVKIITSV